MALLRNLLDAINDNLIMGNAYYLIIKGALITVEIAFIAWFLSFLLGSLVSYFMCYEKRLVSGLAKGICFVLRSAPALIIILLFYYVFAKSSKVDSIILVGIALGLHGAGHFAEIMARSVMIAQFRQDVEVTRRLKKSFYGVVLPQAIEEAWFNIKRLVVHILQWTAVVGYVSVNDLTEVMVKIGQRTMYPFFSLFCCYVFYMGLTVIIEGIFSALSRKFVPYEPENRRIMEEEDEYGYEDEYEDEEEA